VANQVRFLWIFCVIGIVQSLAFGTLCQLAARFSPMTVVDFNVGYQVQLYKNPCCQLRNPFGFDFLVYALAVFTCASATVHVALRIQRRPAGLHVRFYLRIPPAACS